VFVQLIIAVSKAVLIIIIIIIIFINCSWVVTRWQWSFYQYDKRQLVTTGFKLGGLREKHVVATCKGGNPLSIRSWTQGNQEKPVSKWHVAGPSGY
jgi:hypothetical protein